MNKRSKNKLGYTLMICVLLSACGENVPTQDAPKDAVHKDFVQRIKTVKAELKSPEEELTLTGKVDYDPDKLVHYMSLVGGVVEKSYFALGDKVQKGQVLADLRSADLSGAKAELASLQAELLIDERNYQSTLALYTDQMASEKELQETLGKVTQTKAEIEKAQNNLSLYSTSKTAGTFGIKAPISGYIVQKSIASGSPVSADGDPLFTVADLSQVWVIANVHAGNLAFVKEGMPVTVKVLSYPGELFEGTIHTLSQVFDPEEKVLKARIVMPNPGLKLKPDMAADIRLKNKIETKLIAVPSDALIFDHDKYFVVQDLGSGISPEQYVIKEVVLQGRNNGISYLASGISEGDAILVQNQLLVYTGLKEK